MKYFENHLMKTVQKWYCRVQEAADYKPIVSLPEFKMADAMQQSKSIYICLLIISNIVGIRMKTIRKEKFYEGCLALKRVTRNSSTLFNNSARIILSLIMIKKYIVKKNSYLVKQVKFCRQVGMSLKRDISTLAHVYCPIPCRSGAILAD